MVSARPVGHAPVACVGRRHLRRVVGTRGLADTIQLAAMAIVTIVTIALLGIVGHHDVLTVPGLIWRVSIAEVSDGFTYQRAAIYRMGRFPLAVERAVEEWRAAAGCVAQQAACFARAPDLVRQAVVRVLDRPRLRAADQRTPQPPAVGRLPLAPLAAYVRCAAARGVAGVAGVAPRGALLRKHRGGRVRFV